MRRRAARSSSTRSKQSAAWYGAADLLPRGRELARAGAAPSSSWMSTSAVIASSGSSFQRSVTRASRSERIESPATATSPNAASRDDERAIGVAALLEVVGQLAQDLRALGGLLGRLDAREVEVDDLIALGVEAGGRPPRDRALTAAARARDRARGTRRSAHARAGR